MYITVIENTVKDGCSNQYIEVSNRFMKEMKTLPGMVDAQVWQDNENPNLVLNILMWESEEASKSDDGSLFLKYKQQLKPHFVTNTSKTYTFCE